MIHIQKHLKSIGKTFLLVSTLSATIFAMDVATYYDIDIKSMQISIEGSKKVLFLLKSGAPLQEQYAVDDELQQNLRNLFASADSTPSKHAGFFMTHQKEVQDFYENDTTLQEQYAQLKEELESVNKQIKSIREEQK